MKYRDYRLPLRTLEWAVGKETFDSLSRSTLPEDLRTKAGWGHGIVSNMKLCCSTAIRGARHDFQDFYLPVADEIRTIPQKSYKKNEILPRGVADSFKSMPVTRVIAMALLRFEALCCGW